MSKHTPGPWRVTEEDGDGKCQYRSIAKTWVIDSQERHLMAFLQAWKGEEDLSIFDEVRANAHLIAAAPELLEALEHITQTPEYKYLYPGTTSLIEKAISKAKGQQP